MNSLALLALNNLPPQKALFARNRSREKIDSEFIELLVEGKLLVALGIAEEEGLTNSNDKTDRSYRRKPWTWTCSD